MPMEHTFRNKIRPMVPKVPSLPASEVIDVSWEWKEKSVEI